MDFSELKTTLQNLTKVKIIKKEISDCLGYELPNYIRREKSKTMLTQEEIEKISKRFGVSESALKGFDKEEYIGNLAKDYVTQRANVANRRNVVEVSYRPNVYLSAGYGIEAFDESAQKMLLDSALFVSARGNRINPKYCEIVRVSGNSMAPEYRNGDRIIIDRSATTLSDGHIYAFRYNGECYVKEINLLGDRIKCISLNKEYDPFYIEKGEDFKVIGKVVPRIRL